MATAPHSALAGLAEAFFEQFSAAAPRGFGKTIDQLSTVTVLAGRYTRATSATVRRFGRDVHPDYLLRVARTPVSAVHNNQVRLDFSRADLDDAADQSLYYLPERIDFLNDDAATMTRLLGPVPDGARWAAAIAADPERARRFAQISTIDACPPTAPSDDVGVLTAIAHHYGTYAADGTHYAKAGAFPAQVGPAYTEAALREVELAIDGLYCLAVVPARLVQPSASANAMREFLVRFVGPSDAPVIQVVYSAARGDAQRPFHQFCFFHAQDGTGLRVPAGAMSTLAPGLALLLVNRPTQGDQRYLESALGHDVEIIDGEAVAYLFCVIAQNHARAELPAWVHVLSEDETIDDDDLEPLSEVDTDDDDDDALDELAERAYLIACPVDRIVELASLPAVERLEEVGDARPAVVTARGHVNHAGMLTAMSVGANDGGNGVMVGVVDSGIHAAHQAFSGRVHKVWTQGVTPANNPPNTTSMNFGRVFSGAGVTAATDGASGHGTHVTAIAAGASAAGYPHAGPAPKASICVAGLRNMRFPLNNAQSRASNRDIFLAAKWIFDEAKAARKPCVVNMSFGYHNHGHDGVDPMSLLLRRLIKSGRRYRRGRLLCAAAGNDRGRAAHSHTDSLAPGATHTFRVVIRSAADITAFNATLASGAWQLPSAFFRFFAQPVPAGHRGCTCDIRVRRGPGPGTTSWMSPQGDHTPMTPQPTVSGTRVEIVNGPPRAYTRAADMWVRLHRVPPLGVQPGIWNIDIRNTSSVPIELHGYCITGLRRNNYAFFRDPTEKALLSSPGVASVAISVAATVNNGPQTGWVVDVANAAAGYPVRVFNRATHAVAGYSNPGPVRSSRRTVSAAAPGQAITAAQAGTTTGSVAKSGTSMASPVVTGLIACLLEKRPRLTVRQAKRLIARASTRPSGVAAHDIGPGRIDAARLFV